MEFTLIPDGSFWMGSPDSDKDADSDEKPRHNVKFSKGFFLGNYEVTQEEYKRVIGRNPSNFSAQGKYPEDVKGQDTWRYPVENVSWEEAIVFCNEMSKLDDLQPYYRAGVPSGGDGYRLPTEAEWEYACRAGTTTRYGFGDDETKLREYAWCGDNAGGMTHQVATRTPNAWGLYDMHGNVWESCWDWHDNKYDDLSPAVDPSGSTHGSAKISRGGAFDSEYHKTRSAVRSGWNPATGKDYVGFRVARNQPEH